MKPSLRPCCRPGTQCALGPGMLQDRRLRHRNLTRRGHRSGHGMCIGRGLKAPNETFTIKECTLGGGAAAAPRTQELAGATLLRNLELSLAQLPAKQRDVLILVWLEEMSYEQVASFLGISVPTVKSRLNLALEQLHRWLTSVDDSPPPSVN